jgi:hypothetical protein
MNSLEKGTPAPIDGRLSDNYGPNYTKCLQTEGEGFEPSSEENPLKRFSSLPHA